MPQHTAHSKKQVVWPQKVA